MADRTVEDRLREEYFDRLPEIRQVAWQVETEIRYLTLPILHNLRHSEQLIVKSRIKDCESAIRKLRRRPGQEGSTFDLDKANSYSLLELSDLAGVRVLVFPRRKLDDVVVLLSHSDTFKDWDPDPTPGVDGNVLAYKYKGLCPDVSNEIRAEYQIVPMLIGLFWEVEHSALYKPSLSAKSRVDSNPMQELKQDVESTLLRFEAGYENLVLDSGESSS